MKRKRATAVGSFLVLGLALPACAGGPPATPTQVRAAPSPAPSPRPPLDPARVGALLGAKPEPAGKSVKVSFPRADVPVEVDGWTMPPFMGLTSWVTFAPAEKPGVEVMLMGDLVLFEDEVPPVMSKLLEGGVEVTALHNHFFFDRPRVFFLHVGGEGSLEVTAATVKGALEAQAAVRAKKKGVPSARDVRPLAGTSSVDAAKLDAVFGTKGTAKDGMYKAVMGRKATAACGCAVGKAEGVNTWAAFAGSEEDAVVDGDFAVTEGELQPVLRSLRASGIEVVAIHHHMTGESPRILFLHYWGRGKPSELAASVKKALDLTAWDEPAQ